MISANGYLCSAPAMEYNFNTVDNDDDDGYDRLIVFEHKLCGCDGSDEP